MKGKQRALKQRGKRLCNLFFLLTTLEIVFERQKAIHTKLSKKHDLSKPVLKNPGRHTIMYNLYYSTIMLCFCVHQAGSGSIAGPGID